MSNQFVGFKLNVYMGVQHEVHHVSEWPFVIGRDHESDIMVLDRSVSRQHLRVDYNGRQITIEDLGSANGTRVDETKLSAQTPYIYREGDKLQLGTGKCFLFIESMMFPAAAGAGPEAQDRGSSLSDLFGGKQSALTKAKAKAEKIISNATAVKQKIAKDAVLAAENKAAEAMEEAAKIIETARLDAEVMIAEGKRLSEEIKANASENVGRELETVKAQTDQMRREAEAKAEQAKLEVHRAKADLEALNRELENRKVSLQGRIKELESEKVKAEETFNQAKRRQVESQEECSTTEDKLSLLKQELESYQTDLANKDARVQAQEARCQELQASYNEQFRALTHAQEKTIKAEEDHRRLIQEMATFNERSASARAERDEAEAKLEQAQVKLRTETERLAVITSQIEDAEAQRRSLLAKAEDTLASAQREAHETLFAAQKEAGRLKELAQKELDGLSERQERLIRKVVNKTYKDQTEAVEKALEKAAKIKSQAEEQRKELLKAAEREMAELDKAADRERKELMAKAKTEAEKRIAAANFEAKEKLAGAKVESQKVTAALEAQTEKLRSSAMQTADEMRAKFLKEFEEEAALKRYNLERELALKQEEHEQDILQAKVVAKSELDAELNSLKSELEREKELQAQTLVQEMNILLGSRLKSYLKESSVSEDGALNFEVSLELEKAIRRAVLGEGETDELRKRVHTLDPRAQQTKVKKFWKRLGTVAAMLIVGAVSYPFVAPHLRSAAKGVIEKSSSSSDDYVERVVEIWKEKPKFETEKSDIFESTYTDRILYTTSYPERELDGAYREKWIIDLNKFVMEELRLHEDATIPFISKEANLVRSLAKKAGKINPEFAEDGVNRLREDEAEFVAEVKNILKTEKNFKRIMEYKKKHYHDFFNSRGTASSPE